MNNAGRDFIKKAAIATIRSQRYKWSDSCFQERLLRFGRELREFEVHPSKIEDVQKLVTADQVINLAPTGET